MADLKLILLRGMEEIFKEHANGAVEHFLMHAPIGEHIRTNPLDVDRKGIIFQFRHALKLAYDLGVENGKYLERYDIPNKQGS